MVIFQFAMLNYQRVWPPQDRNPTLCPTRTCHTCESLFWDNPIWKRQRKCRDLFWWLENFAITGKRQASPFLFIWGFRHGILGCFYGIYIYMDYFVELWFNWFLKNLWLSWGMFKRSKNGTGQDPTDSSLSDDDDFPVSLIGKVIFSQVTNSELHDFSEG